jgi:glycosyltransferase involved in cell wall biosynthesis
MRVVYYCVNLDSRFGGPPKTTIDLAVGMANAGHEVVLMTADVGDAKIPAIDAANRGSLRIAVTPGPRLPGATLMPGDAAKHDPHIQGADALHIIGVFDGTPVQLSSRARRLGVPYHISLAGMLDDDCFSRKAWKKRLFMSLVGWRWLAGARAIHCTAEEELRQSSRFFDTRLGVVIPNFVDLAPFATEPNPSLAAERFAFLRSPTPVIVFLGRLHRIKNLELLIDAAGVLRRRGVDLAVALAGPGEEAYVAELKSRATSAGVGDQLHFTGLVSGDVKLSLLRAARVFAMPSLHENFGIAMVEALLAGTPAVLTKGVKIWRELESSGGATVTGETPEAFADGLERYLRDGAMARTAGEAARRWGMAFLEPRRVIEQFEAMYARRG